MGKYIVIWSEWESCSDVASQRIS